VADEKSPKEITPEPISTEIKARPLPTVRGTRPRPKAKPIKPKKPPKTVQPEFWDRVFDSLPPWIDEIAGIAMFVFGVLSIWSLIDQNSSATVARAWASVLTQAFGKGGIFIGVGILLVGILIWLPKLGVFITYSPRRLLALEIAFLVLLALFHLTEQDNELRAIARAGQGGGFIGWGMSAPIYALFGEVFAIFFYGVILAMCMAMVVGIRRKHIRQAFTSVENFLYRTGEAWASIPMDKPQKKVAKPVISPSKPAPLPDVEKMDMGDSHKQRVTIMRIRPDFTVLPPSQRPTLDAPPPKPKPKPFLTPTTELEADLARLERILTQSEKPTDLPGQLKGELSALGTLLPRKGKDPQQVERPDGRIKRYFTTESMKENKKVVKRDKSLPPLELLQDVEFELPSEEEINRNVVLIENTLLEFDINIDVVDVKAGPTVTQYAVQPFREVKDDEGDLVKERTRLSKIASLANDLALALSAKRLRMELPVPGYSYMGIEVPNRNAGTVALRSVYESKAFYDAMAKAKSPLIVPLGRDVAGEPIIVDLAGMPHLLVAGTTGSGKSVAIAAIATALLLNTTPDEVQLIMLDPKMVELSRFNGVPHLLGPVETDMDRIIGVLRWCTREMDRRYKLLEEAQSRNIEVYNSRLGPRKKAEHLPYVVILVDEIGDLMMSKPDETEKTVTRLAQMARAVGMHLVIATQRPSVDVITGLIKANFPSRIAFAVASGVDSRVILDSVGGETLLGRGDMLYLAADAGVPKRLQGCFVSDSEVRSVVQYWKDWAETQAKEAKSADTYVRTSAPWERALTRREFLAETDPMLEDAIELVVNEQEASASMIQRKLGLGYPRAARLVDLLEEIGVIGESIDGGRTRKVLIAKGKDPFQEILDKRKREGR